MRESEPEPAVRSKAFEERSCKFGTVVRALWPDKPAINLAQRAGCTERAASFYIKGDRAPSLDAILVIVDEIRG